MGSNKLVIIAVNPAAVVVTNFHYISHFCRESEPMTTEVSGHMPNWITTRYLMFPSFEYLDAKRHLFSSHKPTFAT